MACSKDQEHEWMLMKQRQRQPRSHSLPQAPMIPFITKPGGKLPHLFGLHNRHNHPPCQKIVDSNEILIEPPSPETKHVANKELSMKAVEIQKQTPILDAILPHKSKTKPIATLQLPEGMIIYLATSVIKYT